MSSIYFNHLDEELRDKIFGLESGSVDYRVKNVFGDLEISELVYDVLNLIIEFGWYRSGRSTKCIHLGVENRFKAKWLVKLPEERLKRCLDDALAGVKDEFYKTFGLKEGEEDVQHKS